MERKGLDILQRDVNVNVPAAQLTSLTRRTVTKANNVTKVRLRELYRRMDGDCSLLFW